MSYNNGWLRDLISEVLFAYCVVSFQSIEDKDDSMEVEEGETDDQPR